MTMKSFMISPTTTRRKSIWCWRWWWLSSFWMFLVLSSPAAATTAATTISQMTDVHSQAQLQSRPPQLRQQQRKEDELPYMLGGYSHISVNDPMAIQAAQFALFQLFSEESTTKEYSFMKPSSSLSTTTETTTMMTTTTSPRILKASMQVVAGINVQLTMMIVQESSSESTTATTTTTTTTTNHDCAHPNNANDNDGTNDTAACCIGALTVIVYNHFGEFSIPTWGDEYTCEEAYSMMDPYEYIEASSEDE